MQAMTSPHEPLNNVLLSSKNHIFLRNVLFVALGSLLLTVSSKIALPLYPVSMTMQTLAVLFVGMVLGWRLGTLSVMLYLAEGAMGVPVFSGMGAGVAAFFSPSGGYLIGFLPAALISGYLVERGWGRSAMKAGCAALIGMVCIYVMGVGYLSTLVGFANAIEYGFVPFLFVSLLKIVFLAFLVPLFWKRKHSA